MSSCEPFPTDFEGGSSFSKLAGGGDYVENEDPDQNFGYKLKIVLFLILP